MASNYPRAGAGVQQPIALCKFRVGVQHQAWTNEERGWLQFVKKLYPNLAQETYFLPPLFFNRVPFYMETVACETVRVHAPYSEGKKNEPNTERQSPTPQVAGTAFIRNARGLQPLSVQNSDWRDDQAQHRVLQALQMVLQALGDVTGQPMVVISQLLFRKYLNNPLYHAATAVLPTSDQLTTQLADGECDVLILHRHYGLLLGEIKSVGGHESFSKDHPEDQNKVICEKVMKAVTQLGNQKKVLSHLVHDLGNVPITKTVLLPNITCHRLRSALTSSPQLVHDLIQCTGSANVDQAIGRCLCSDHLGLGQPSTWWRNLWPAVPDTCMSTSLYERLVARFCGPATSVEIPTVFFPQTVVIRSKGQAVAETGRRYGHLTLTVTQLKLLNRHPEPRRVHLQGPPGTGKTVVLLLKALQWARRGRKVAIVTRSEDAAVARLIEQQLHCILGASAATTIQRHCPDFDGAGFDVPANVAHLQGMLGPDPAIIICDEAEWGSRHFTQWVTKVLGILHDVALWTAGVTRQDTSKLPPGMVVEAFRDPLRCPPTVIKQVDKSAAATGLDIPRYTVPSHTEHTQGPPVRRLQHRGQPGHTGVGVDHLQCEACADLIADFLEKELRVGQPDHSLQYRDVWILCGSDAYPRDGDPMIQRLRDHHDLPVRAVGRPLSGVDARDGVKKRPLSGVDTRDDVKKRPLSGVVARELALAVTDHIIVTHHNAVQGLERMVVIDLGGHFHSSSRCTSQLCVIE